MRHYLDRVVGAMPPAYAAAYDQSSFWSSHFGALLFEHLELRPNVRGLDVGCATGFPLIELAEVHGAGSQFDGIDPWEEAVARAREKIAILGIANAAAHVGDAASMPFGDHTFDLVTSNCGINNFDDPPAVMREIARVSKSGARLVVTTNPTGHLREFYDLFRSVLRGLGLSDLLARLGEQEAHRGSLESITALLGGAGFEVTRSATGEFALRFAGGAAMMNHSLVQWFLDGWRPVVGAEREREVFEEIERRLDAASPLRFTVPMLYVEGVRG